MQPEQVQYIRDRLADWAAVPDTGKPLVIRNEERVLFSSHDLARTARHLLVLVDACEASLSRREGDADRAWAVTFLGSLALIWSDRPDYPKASQ